MRTAFINKVTELAKRDPNVWLVTGDLGFSVFEGFKEQFPDQYLNVGVAEQNLMSVAAGLALAGKRPIVYSISTFASMRPYEQIRNDICYQNLPVIIIGGGSTFSYSTFGCTHMPLEDLGIMRMLPNMAVLSPGDPVEVSALLEQAYARGGPAYMRIAKKGEPIVHAAEDAVTLGTPTVVAEGSDVGIFVSGRLLPSALQAAELLKAEGISASVVSVHTLKPCNEEVLQQELSTVRAVVTCEEHQRSGALGSLVLETLARTTRAVPITILGIPDEFPKGVASQDAFLARYNLTPEGIRDAARALLS